MLTLMKAVGLGLMVVVYVVLTLAAAAGGLPVAQPVWLMLDDDD